LTRIARLRVSNILQYYPQPKLEKIVGEEATKQFQQELALLGQKGVTETENLMKVGNEEGKDDIYKKNFREIRLENQEFVPDVKGQFNLQSSNKPFTFFPLKPEYYLPAKGAFDIKFAAGSTLPISKPMMQTKKTEMFDRLLPLATAGVYDIKKMGDQLLKANDENPADYAPDQPDEGQDEQSAQMQMELATTENNLMMQGQSVPATPYVGPAHTSIHVQFTGSPDFQDLTTQDPRVQIFQDHIMGELASQDQRQNGQMEEEGGIPRATPTTKASGGGNRGVRELMPDKVQGGEMQRRQAPV
jgi:hypothetical protein